MLKNIIYLLFFAIYNLNYTNMEKTYHSLKDFELSYGKNAIERANDFQQYIEQLNDFGCKSYWITSHTGIGSTMAIEGFNEPVIAFISNDYLGMSQREETKTSRYRCYKKNMEQVLALHK
mgnify:CR=1 FL=1